jgi:DNA (cytosine-5)-methyltransferase 1
LNAVNLGVPQVRERVFVIAVKNKFKKSPEIKQTHFFDFKSSRVSESILSESTFFRLFLQSSNLKPAVTVEDAICDLPVLFPDVKSRYSLKAVNSVLPYKTLLPQNDYQKLMRTWYSYTEPGSTANSFRKTLRDFPIFAEMKEGDDYRQAHSIALKRLADAAANIGITENSHPEIYNQLKKKILPPYSKDKFHEKWKKLTLRKPSHTLVAHLSVDTYSHIHPLEPRGISVREAARLQSFPDGFLFQRSMGDAFKQIGNAVPPLMAQAIALAIKNVITK